MICRSLTLRNKRGLHARASARLNDVARRFQASIELEHHERTADARSIMAIMMLAAPCGSAIRIRVQGDDEQEAFNAIEQLINNRFDEDA